MRSGPLLITEPTLEVAMTASARVRVTDAGWQALGGGDAALP
jgi:hypothetical protein